MQTSKTVSKKADSNSGPVKPGRSSFLCLVSDIVTPQGGGLRNLWQCDTICTMLTKQKKSKTIKEVAVHDTDTGSPEVQVALLSKQIDELTSHLKKHLKDKHSRRGLLQMVADRRTHLKYLEGKDKKRYNALVKKLNLKK